MIQGSEFEPGLESEHELEVLAPEAMDDKELSNYSLSPGLVQYSPRAFWTGIGSVQISTGVVLIGTGPVHSNAINPMSPRVSHTISY